MNEFFEESILLRFMQCLIQDKCRQVVDDVVTLYMDCIEFSSVRVRGRSRDLRFEKGSTLFIGRGGDKEGRPFWVSTVIPSGEYSDTLC